MARLSTSRSHLHPFFPFQWDFGRPDRSLCQGALEHNSFNALPVRCGAFHLVVLGETIFPDCLEYSSCLPLEKSLFVLRWHFQIAPLERAIPKFPVCSTCTTTSNICRAGIGGRPAPDLSTFSFSVACSRKQGSAAPVSSINHRSLPKSPVTSSRPQFGLVPCQLRLKRGVYM